MSFNPDPTKQAVEVLFSRKKSTINHPPLYFNNTVVTCQEDHKHLGVTLDRKLSFAKHIKEKIATARRGIGLIRHVSPYVPFHTLDQMYKIFVRPHLDYCDVIYHVPPHQESGTYNFSLNYLMKSIESTQYEAARAVTGTWKSTSSVKLYEELGWESLSDRRTSRRLIQFYKIYNRFTPPYLRSLIPEPLSLLFGRRRENVLRNIICRTVTFSNSFFPDSVKNWNNLGVEFRQIDSLSKFKNEIRNLFVPKKKSVFGLFHPIGIKRLFQLRVCLSPLKKHKYDHKFDDTPSSFCDCGMASEDTEHFFFECPFFLAHRLVFMENILEILSQKGIVYQNQKELLQICLYGHSSLNNEANKNVLQETIAYIFAGNRFS